MTSHDSTTIDRARAYGDGLFETIAIRHGAARFWDLHFARLQTGCARLGITCPKEPELQAKLEIALAESDIDLSFGSLRLVVAAAQSQRGYRRAASSEPDVSFQLFSSAPLPKELVAEGVTVRNCKLRLAEQPALAGIKSLNRLEQVLARAEWSDPGIFEGLLLDTSDRLICGTMSNVFAIINSKICTPTLDRCGVAGVMRTHVMRRLSEDGQDISVRDIDALELSGATELFLTNSQFGVLPVRSLEKMPLSIGPVTRLAQSLIAADGVPECSP